MTMITPSYLGETIEYSSLHACRSTLEDPTKTLLLNEVLDLDQRQTRPTSQPVQNTVPDQIIVAHANTGSNCQK